MNGFKKLILTTAILAASGSAMAMQALDDASLSSTTGQDGLTLTINQSTITDLDLTWVDRGGFGATYTTDGGVAITNIGVDIQNLVIDVDAGSSGSGSQLNIDFATTDDVVISLNNTKISVGDASAVDTNSTAMTSTSEIVRFGAAASVTLQNGLSGSIKLGTRGATEHFMHFETATPIDLQLTGGVVIVDSGDNGIGVGTITVNGLDVDTDIDVVAGGLQITSNNSTIGQVSLEDIKLGDQTSAVSLGDVYLTGMQVSSVITLAGHN